MIALKFDEDIVEVRCDTCHQTIKLISAEDYESRYNLPFPILCPACLDRIWRHYEEYFRLHFCAAKKDKNAKPPEKKEEKTCEERLEKLERRVDFLMKARAEDLQDRIVRLSGRNILEHFCEN